MIATGSSPRTYTTTGTFTGTVIVWLDCGAHCLFDSNCRPHQKSQRIAIDQSLCNADPRADLWPLCGPIAASYAGTSV